MLSKKSGFRGDTTFIVGSSSPDIEVLEVNKHTLRVEIDEREFDIKKGKSETDTYEIEMEYGDGNSRKATIEITVTHRGKIKAISHSDDYVLPKTPENKKRVEMIKRRNQDRDTESGHEIIDHPKAYRYKMDGGED